MKRNERKDFFFQKMFQDPQTRQMNLPKVFGKNPFRTNYSSIFSPKVQNVTVFSIIYMIRIRLSGRWKLITESFRAHGAQIV